MQLEKDHVVVRGDATSAYEPELGVKKFVRQFEYRPAEGFTITDEVDTAEPTVITSLLHADTGLQKETTNRFSINVGGVKLLVEPLEPRTSIARLM